MALDDSEEVDEFRHADDQELLPGMARLNHRLQCWLAIRHWLELNRDCYCPWTCPSS